MNSYFTVRIKLQNLDKKNNKQEYRDLYKHMYDRGFREYYFDKNDEELILLESMYAILSFDYTAEKILEVAEEAIELALKPFYHDFSNRYQIIVTGPSPILSNNLDAAK